MMTSLQLLCTAVLLLLPASLSLPATSTPVSVAVALFNGDKAANCPEKCDPRQCKSPTPCRRPIKLDDCGCCLVCPPAVTNPVKKTGEACEDVTCSGQKFCIVNIQGLPLCKCPSEVICSSAKREPVCGSDGTLYYSRCHRRLQECRSGRKIGQRKRKYCEQRQTRKGLLIPLPRFVASVTGTSENNTTPAVTPGTSLSRGNKNRLKPSRGGRMTKAERRKLRKQEGKNRSVRKPNSRRKGKKHRRSRMQRRRRRRIMLRRRAKLLKQRRKKRRHRRLAPEELAALLL